MDLWESIRDVENHFPYQTNILIKNQIFIRCHILSSSYYAIVINLKRNHY